ncbi:sugar phosphate isomerase/epimerase family protein [Novisyntrophococcus fermenticellae]|uniref:sugar phosphate isomerase/epimerase family protein n=1 Tax=Novisyntrophococcus fermenticellae TaxID=2068655 RepID=UPI001E3B6421|nr:sugar phosphate isomerase/epimerase family protein [Novisyntrophococcus fermenticellae]
MIFGMPTLIELNGLEETMVLCQELGLHFVELNMNLPQYQLNHLEKIEELKGLKDKYQLFYTIHIDENLNVSDFNPLVAKAYMETVKRTIQIAKKLEIPILNMHMNHGVHFTLPDRKVKLFEQYRETYLESITGFRDMCEQIIGHDDIHICMENTDGFMDYEKEAIELLLQSNVFALTWDIGHSNSCDNKDEAFIIKHEKQLQHFHIHDGNNKSDHMTLGTGEIDLNGRLDLAKMHNCRCVVETKTVDALRESIQWLKANNYLEG